MQLYLLINTVNGSEVDFLFQYITRLMQKKRLETQFKLNCEIKRIKNPQKNRENTQTSHVQSQTRFGVKRQSYNNMCFVKCI